MALTNAQIFTRIGMTNAGARNAVIADFLSEGLEGLAHMTDEDVRDTCASYAKRQDGQFPVILTPIQKQRLKSLVLYVKDRRRVNQALEFPNTLTPEEFRDLLSNALERERRRKDQKKSGESYLDSTFNNKLKSTAQWEKWNEELEATLCQIIGVRGVPLTYIIREADAPAFDPDVPYDEAVTQAMILTGVEFAQDARTVHKIILKNVHEDSDAYTYIKPLIRFRNGRRDILSLRERYSSDATRQNIINKAKADLNTLRYKNERSFSFEKFSAKLQKAYDELEDAGRPVNNGDIVDDLWDRVQASDLQLYVASLKVEYQRNLRDYKLILQDIAAEAGKKMTVTFARSANVSATYTRKGPCPSSGVHTTDGDIFIGSYDKDKWQSDQVRQYHQEILKARTNDGGSNQDGRQQLQGQKRKINAIKRNRKKLKTLEAKIAAAKAQLKQSGKKESSAEDEQHSNAGDAFGGKRSRQG
jgi:hypothetical protein